jgi:hypothetical protein
MGVHAVVDAGRDVFRSNVLVYRLASKLGNPAAQNYIERRRFLPLDWLD